MEYTCDDLPDYIVFRSMRGAGSKYKVEKISNKEAVVCDYASENGIRWPILEIVDNINSGEWVVWFEFECANGGHPRQDPNDYLCMECRKGI